MADHSVAAGGYGSPLFALTASQVSTVTFDEDLKDVEVYSDGSAPVWWTCDGSTPTTTGNGYCIPTTAVDHRQPKTGNNTVVKLISTGAPSVRVQRAD